jgi:hypothetical protein
VLWRTVECVWLVRLDLLAVYERALRGAQVQDVDPALLVVHHGRVLARNGRMLHAEVAHVLVATQHEARLPSHAQLVHRLAILEHAQSGEPVRARRRRRPESTLARRTSQSRVPHDEEDTFIQWRVPLLARTHHRGALNRAAIAAALEVVLGVDLERTEAVHHFCMVYTTLTQFPFELYLENSL